MADSAPTSKLNPHRVFGFEEDVMIVFGLVAISILALWWWFERLDRAHLDRFLGLPPLPTGSLLTEARPSGGRQPVETRGRFPVQILFFEEQAGRARLDCVLLEAATAGDVHLPPGSPVSLSLSTPHDDVLTAAMHNVLGRWASEARVVVADALIVHGEPRVELKDGQTSIQLDLEEASL